MAFHLRLYRQLYAHMRAALCLVAMLSLLAFTAASLASTFNPVPAYELFLGFDLNAHRLQGVARIEAAAGDELTIAFGTLKILSIMSGGQSVAPDISTDGVTVTARGPLEIHYEGRFDGADEDLIDTDHVILRNLWYPVIDGVYRYRLSVTLPKDFLAVSEGDSVDRTEHAEMATTAFDLAFPQRPWDGISFVASRHWTSHYAQYGNVSLSVHVLTKNGSRADSLLQRVQHYLIRLEERLGPYPFSRLAVVENPTSMSYSVSMPTYVLLTQRSVAADAIEDDALNHEIAHAWFGNGVLINYTEGNWSEGLASYFSDHLRAEESGRGWEQRQRMMAAYQGFVTSREQPSLSDFEQSSDRPTRVIGYGKAALVFHMLRRVLGDTQFFSGMRRFVNTHMFAEASWSDIRRAMEIESGLDLSRFFGQWVSGSTIPSLRIDATSVKQVPRGFELAFAIQQQSPPLLLRVPIRIYFDEGESTRRFVEVTQDRNDYRVVLERRPTRIVMDDDYDIHRRLVQDEIPSSIATLLGRKQAVVISTPEERAKYDGFLRALELEGLQLARVGMVWPSVQRQSPLHAADSHGRLTAPSSKTSLARNASSVAMSGDVSLILLGRDNPWAKSLVGPLDLPRRGFAITVRKHPANSSELIAIVTAESKAQVEAAYAEVLRRPRFGTVVYLDGKPIQQELHVGHRGIPRALGFQ